MSPDINPRYPLYVVSHERADTCLTVNALSDLGVPHSIVIEPDQYDAYAEHHDEDKLLIVPDEYHERYKTYDDLGREKSQGPGPARNFAWEHAKENGHDWYWVMDDNIRDFYRYHNNKFTLFGDGSFFRGMEDFVLQYKNIAMAGPRYFMFIIRKEEFPPLTFNSRIYSCNLIRTDLDYRWAGRYNEDTDLSLRMLKDGWCTTIFNTFLQYKMPTQKLDGGNTENFYKHEGTYAKSKMLKEQHPEVTKLTKKWDRWHHHVNYQPFKSNTLDPKDDPDIEIADYEYDLVQLESDG